MNMITRKKLIAALLIPIMLIAFSTPSFAASTTSVDLQGFANKALGFIMEIGGVSLDIAKNFAGEFMDVNGLNDVLDRVPELATTGFSAIGDLVGVFTSTNFTSVTDALKIIPKLLKFVVNTGIDFCNIIFPGYGFDLANPSSFFKFATDLFGFAVESGKLLADVVLENVDLNDIGDSISGLLNGSTGDLSGIFNTLLQGNTQLPSFDLSGAVANFDKTSFINLLGNITSMGGGFVGDILNSGMDIVGGLLNSLPATEPDSSQNIVDFTNTLTNSISGIAGIVENTIVDKAPINDEPVNDSTDLNRPQYDGYTLIVEQSTLNNVLNYIKTNEYFHELTSWSKLHAVSYVCLLQNKNWDINNADEICSQLKNKAGGLPTLYEYMKSKEAQPAIVRIEDDYWVTCVGYKGDGKQISDFLFIDTLTGSLKRGGQDKIKSIDPMNQYDAICIFE